MATEIIIQTLIFIFLVFILIFTYKKIAKSNLNKKHERRFFGTGIVIWTIFYLVYFFLIRILLKGTFSYFRLSLLIMPFIMGLLTGFLIMLLLFKKIKMPFYIGAMIGLLIILIGNIFPPTHFYLSSINLLTQNSLSINLANASISKIIIYFVFQAAFTIILVGLIYLLLYKILIKKRRYGERKN